MEGKLGLKDALRLSNEGQTQSHVNGRGPVLHGLCTLGYSLRAVLRHVHRSQKHKQNEPKSISIQCNFVKPVFVNDVLCVEVWDDGLKCPSNGRPVFDNFFFFVLKNNVTATINVHWRCLS